MSSSTPNLPARQNVAHIPHASQAKNDDWRYADYWDSYDADTAALGGRYQSGGVPYYQKPAYQVDAHIRPNGAIELAATTPYTLSQVKEALGPNAMALVRQVLIYKRSTGAECHAYVVDKLKPLLVRAGLAPIHDANSNLFVKVRDDKGFLPKRVFTCHTDTVHNTKGTQSVAFDVAKRVLFKDDGECLGADDGTGVYILLRMIEAQIPGTYAFFADEESGRVGSTAALKASPDFWVDTDAVISFDRKEDCSVITRQSGRDCCSAAFAQALCDRITEAAPETIKIEPDPTGSFTDSATFMSTIAECTNLSVGYKHQHGPREFQSLDQLDNLLAAFLQMDWNNLPIKRDPKAAYTPPKPQAAATTPAPKKRKKVTMEMMLDYDPERVELAEYLAENPATAAFILYHYFNLTEQDIRDAGGELFMDSALDVLESAGLSLDDLTEADLDDDDIDHGPQGKLPL